jgi:hypothetical protein
VSFFEVPEPKRRPSRRRGERVDCPWTRPATYLPSYLQDDLVVASNAEAAVVLHGIACYPTGFAFSLETVTRHEYDGDEDEPHYADLFWSARRRGSKLPPGLLRFGISFSDGQKATTLDATDAMDVFEPSEAGSGLRLHLGGGGGGGGRWSYEIWVTPLPPPGPVTLVCEWPAFGITETRCTIDGVRFIEAAEKAKPIF